MQFKSNNPWWISPSLLEYAKAVMSFVQNRFPLWISLSTSHLCFQYLQNHSHRLLEILGVKFLSNPTIVNWLSLNFLICQQIGICQQIHGRPSFSSLCCRFLDSLIRQLYTLSCSTLLLLGFSEASCLFRFWLVRRSYWSLLHHRFLLFVRYFFCLMA